MGSQGCLRSGCAVSNLDRALAKVKHYPHLNNQWGGYLTPSEFVALVDAGATPAHAADVDWDRKYMAAGNCRPRWRYFYPDKAMTIQLAEKAQHKKVGTREKL